MIRRQRDRSLGDGVYFRDDDYIGLEPRLLILLVDGIVVASIVWLLSIAWVNLAGDYSLNFLGIVAFAVWLYVVALKRSNFRTIGYRLTCARLVTLKGDRPSLFMLTFRSLLWIFGPFNLLIDLIWCGIDEDRQTMRDRFTNMCLVRNQADPVGKGEIHLAYFNAFGYSLAYPRVVHPKLAK